MIAPLRTAHRWLWTLLAILLPVLLYAAIAARVEPVSDGLPPELADRAENAAGAPGR